jgi:predicted ester cyclase
VRPMVVVVRAAGGNALRLRADQPRPGRRRRVVPVLHLVGDGDIVVQHLTLHGTHRASTMPLLADVFPSGRPAAWTFIHIWRVADGMIVEHWACRDDMGLLDQL